MLIVVLEIETRFKMDYLQQMNLTDFTLYDLINVKGVGKCINIRQEKNEQ